jgi:hypothetical protein
MKRYTVKYGACTFDDVVGRFTDKQKAIAAARAYCKEHNQFVEVTSLSTMIYPAWLEGPAERPTVIARFWPKS